MSSSRSTTVRGLIIVAPFRYGTESFEFTMSFVLFMIVIYGAIGVRRETGKQAKLLNSILSENLLKPNAEVLQEKFKEYAGHTPLQVLVGVILGIGLTLTLSFYY